MGATTSLNEDELYEQLAGDMMVIFKTIYKNGPITKGEVRACANVLRKWLCDGLLQRAAHEWGKSISIPGVWQEKAQTFIDREFEWFVFTQTKINGSPIFALYSHLHADKPTPEINAFLNGIEFPILSIKKFRSLPQVFADGIWYRTDEVIRFLANKRGGVHYDQEMNAREAKMLEAVRSVTLGGPKSNPRADDHRMHMEVEESGDDLDLFETCLLGLTSGFMNLQIDGHPVLQFKRTLIGRFWDFLNRRRGFRFSVREWK